MKHPRYVAVAAGLVALTLAVFALPLLFFPSTPELGSQPASSAPGPTGWAGPKYVDQARGLVASFPRFQIRGQLVQDNSRKNVRLWEAVRQVNDGKDFPCISQAIGDCVSWGWRKAIVTLGGVAKFKGELAGELHDIFPPYHYGTSRVLIGGGRLDGDGSIGAWAAQAVKEYGVLSVTADGVPAYSGPVARAWGARGPPSEFVEIGRQFPVRTVSLVNTASAIRDAVCNGYPTAICSDFGTQTYETRNGRIYARGDGSWNHCMCITAYDGRYATDGRGDFYVENSWGPTAHPAPLQNEPAGGFWITWEQAEYIAKQDDSFAVSNWTGFPGRDLDFNVLAMEGGDVHEPEDLGGDGPSWSAGAELWSHWSVAASDVGGEPADAGRVLSAWRAGGDPGRFARPGPERQLIDELRRSLLADGKRVPTSECPACDAFLATLRCDSSADRARSGGSTPDAGRPAEAGRSEADCEAAKRAKQLRRLVSVGWRVVGHRLSSCSAAADPLLHTAELHALPQLGEQHHPGGDSQRVDDRIVAELAYPGDRAGRGGSREDLPPLSRGGRDASLDLGRGWAGDRSHVWDQASPRPANWSDGAHAALARRDLSPLADREFGPGPDGLGTEQPVEWQFPFARWLARQLIDAITAFFAEFLASILSRMVWLLIAAAAAAGATNAFVGRLCDRIFGGRR